MSSAAPKRRADFEASSDVRSLTTIVYDANGLVMGTWKNVALHVWTTRATPQLVDELERLSESFARAHPEGFSAVHVIANGAGLPDNQARDRLRDVANRYVHQLACLCHVVEGSGFWASALHSFLTGLHWLTRGPYRLHICSDLRAAAQWVPEPHERRTRVSLAETDLEDALLYVRGRAPPRA